MSFVILQLGLAALAVALVVVAVVIVREMRRRRGPQVPKPAREARAPLLRKAPPEPEPEEAAPPRRRQLHAIVEQARSEGASESAPPPANDTGAEAADHAAGEPDDYAQAVLGRLERAFEALQAGEITLDTYRARVLAEESAVDRRVAELEGEYESDELDAALAARESARWCLDWADEQRDQEQSQE
jgi:hypothetical protein